MVSGYVRKRIKNSLVRQFENPIAKQNYILIETVTNKENLKEVIEGYWCCSKRQLHFNNEKYYAL